MLNSEINKWVNDVFGVDPGLYLERHVPANASDDQRASNEANQSVEPDEAWLTQSTEAGPVSPAAPDPPPKKKKAIKGAVDLNKQLHEFKGPKVAVLAGCFDAQFVWTVEVKGKIETIVEESDDTTTVTAMAYDDGAISQKVARTWSDTDGVHILGIDTAFTEVEFEGAAKIKDGIEVSVSASGKLGCGVAFSIEARLMKVDEQSHVEGPELSCGIALPSYSMPSASIDLGAHLRLSDAQVQPVVNIKLEPSWPHIWAQVAKKFAQDTALKAAAEKGLEATTSAVGVDVAIASGFLAIAAASIAASVGAIGELGDARKAAEQAHLLSKGLLASYKSGLLSDGQPSFEALMPGYLEGVIARNTAVTKLRAGNPDITDEQVTQVLLTVADRVVAHAQPELDTMVRTAVWESYASTHRDGGWGGSRRFQRSTAWSGIFGRPPNGEELWTRYDG